MTRLWCELGGLRSLLVIDLDRAILQNCRHYVSFRSRIGGVPIAIAELCLIYTVASHIFLASPRALEIAIADGVQD